MGRGCGTRIAIAAPRGAGKGCEAAGERDGQGSLALAWAAETS